MTTRAARTRSAAVMLWQTGAALSSFYLSLLCWFFLVAIVPLVIGWQPYLIISGSMAPKIQPGSIVVAQPFKGELDLGEGTVIVFRDEANRTVTHRIVDVNWDGEQVTGYVTKGDANRVPDSSPVPPENVQGVGRILSPWIGLPAVWALQGQWHYVAGWLLLTLVAARMTWRAWTGPPGRTLSDDEDALNQPADEAVQPREPVPVAALIVCALIAFGGPGDPYSHAAFADTTQSTGNTISASSSFVQDFTNVSSSNLVPNQTQTQQLSFTLGAALAAGETVTIDLTGAWQHGGQGPNFRVDYHGTTMPIVVSDGGAATIEVSGGPGTPGRSAVITYTAPAGGVASESTVVIDLPGVQSSNAHAGYPVTFTRNDSGFVSTTTFDVVP
jgi:signal peptidase I